MTIGAVVPLLVFLFPLAYSPGPGNMFFAAIAARTGIRAAVPALAGYHVATFVVTAAIGAGMGLTLLRDPVVATVLAASGALYVLWLAVQFWRSGRSATADPGTAAAPVRGTRFVDGILILVLNPKAYSIVGLLFTQFLTADGSERPLGQVLALTVVFTGNNLLAFVVWSVAGAALNRVLADGGVRRRVDYVFAAVLAGTGVWLAWPLFS